MTLTLLILLGASIWFWLDNLAAREKAIAAGMRACAQINVQFLDQSVALGQLRLGRHPESGRLTWRRRYDFTFSVNGADRYTGQISMLGKRVTATTLSHPEGVTHL